MSFTPRDYPFAVLCEETADWTEVFVGGTWYSLPAADRREQGDGPTPTPNGRQVCAGCAHDPGVAPLDGCGWRDSPGENRVVPGA